MGKGKKHESAAQERKNLLGINPIPDHASGSWMSKHSIASSGSNSPLHDWGIYQSDIKKSGKEFGDIARGGKSALEGVKKASGNIIKKLDKNIHKISKKEDKDFIRSKRRV
tara:strand:+ start:951 stop:1283 length:333 start_codon:yes stop_codon:yes gene_type:complete